MASDPDAPSAKSDDASKRPQSLADKLRALQTLRCVGNAFAGASERQKASSVPVTIIEQIAAAQKTERVAGAG